MIKTGKRKERRSTCLRNMMMDYTQCTVLVADDDRDIVRAIATLLEQEGLPVLRAYNGLEALEAVAEHPVSLILIDVMMPKLDGLSAMMKIREQKNIPILILSAKSEESDKILGLSMGADDYMTKPFAIEELLARIRVGLKKRRSSAAETPAPASNVLQAGGLVLEPSSYTVTMNNQPINLTKKEFDLLKYLMSHKGEAVTRDALLTDVWGYDYAGDTNVVDVYIR